MTPHPLLAVSAVLLSLSGSSAWLQEFELSCTSFPEAPSQEQLQSLFGADSVQPDSIFGADDGPLPGLVVFSDRVEARVDVGWVDPERRDAVGWMTTRGSHWVTSQGLRVGDDLRSAEARNGWPFRLSGFGREGGSGGQVLSWGRGTFRGPDHGTCREIFTFQHGYDGTVPRDALAQVESLDEVSSGHPAMQRINPKLVAITLVYPRRAAR